MGFRNLIGNFLGQTESGVSFEMLSDSDGVNFVLKQDDFNKCERGLADTFLLMQFAYLQMLVEQGEAERIPNGFVIADEVIAALDEDGEQILKLPPRFSGKFETKIDGISHQSNFAVSVIAVTDQNERVPHHQLQGALLSLSSREKFRLRPEEFTAFEALNKHQNMAAKSEDDNLWLIGQLQASKTKGMQIDLSHFDSIQVDRPEKIGLAATAEEDGSLTLAPNFGVGIEADDFESRKWQVEDENAERAALRIKDKIVVLDDQKLSATQEILTNRHIPKSQVQEFLKTPSAFIDASLVDLDLGFSVRVKGAAVFTYMPIDDADRSSISWFEGEAGAFAPHKLYDLIKSDEDLVHFNEVFSEARRQGAEQLVFSECYIDVRDTDRVVEILKDIKGRFAQNIYPGAGLGKAKPPRVTVDVEVAEGLRVLADVDEREQRPLDPSIYNRIPYPHQSEGIEWFIDLATKAIQSDPEDAYRLQGALLADDMGLGKTFMSLVGLNEIYRELEQQNKTCKPVLVVAPLSLLENWEDEVSLTFKESPFDDIVVLQSARDLKTFKKDGASVETTQDVDEDEIVDQNAIRYALKIGSSSGPERLDMPKRLVLTTYQTLRDYQFSLCRVDWSVAIFDEAQNIKNPNTLQTRAAKGIKADFKLLVTGTPVENSLCDFWCLLDTAQPGLLGSWDEFREKYVLPITSAEDEAECQQIRGEIGQNLRSDVGKFMLRRLKEDSLSGMPDKRIYTGVAAPGQVDWQHDARLVRVMDGYQLQRYDEVIKHFQASEEVDRRKIVLPTLQKLRELSLHPKLDFPELNSSKMQDSMKLASESGKLTSVIELLKEIQSRDEKVLIFLINKKLQLLLKMWLQAIFNVPVEVINGDVKAVSKNKSTPTRRKIIADFEAKPGFGILIMSPVAAGVGLTVIGANNVIHLERHWNPAKEAQATDRVYRIGQKKDVNIYLPTLLHPERQSFDENLDLLLSQKMSLKDAVVTPQVVTSDDLGGALGL